MLKSYAAIMMTCLALTLPQAAVAATAQEARQFADTVGKRVIEVLNGGGGGDAQKQEKLRQLFLQNVDIAWMGKFAVGAPWQQATPTQRENYARAYQEYLLARYTTNFSDYNGSKYTITEVRDDGDGQFTVRMQINTTGKNQELLAGYRLHTAENGQLKIFDIMVEGVSLITTQRAEFGASVQQGGMDALIANLAGKTK